MKPLIINLIDYLNNPAQHKENISPFWISNHIGIMGKDRAYSATKASVKLTIDEDIKIPRINMEP